MHAPTMPFMREWLIVATSVTAITLLEVVILTLFLVPQASLGLALIHLIVTVLTYPVVVALIAQPFGLRRPKSGDRNLIVGRPA
jgi:rod shape-determining protein MreD